MGDKSKIWKKKKNVKGPMETPPATCLKRVQLTAHNWQKWKGRFLACSYHKIYRAEAVDIYFTMILKKYEFGAIS